MLGPFLWVLCVCNLGVKLYCKNVINERFNQTQPASTDGNLVVEENIAVLFVYLPLCPWGHVLTLVGGSSCLGAQAGCGATTVGPLPATGSQPTSSQPHALARLPSTGIFLLPQPLSLQEEGLTQHPHSRSWCGAHALHPTVPVTHDTTRIWS